MIFALWLSYFFYQSFVVINVVTLSNMPERHALLRRPCLPAQTIHESCLQFLFFSFHGILASETSVHYRARRGEWRKPFLSRTLICAASLFKHKQLAPLSPYTYHLRFQGPWPSISLFAWLAVNADASFLCSHLRKEAASYADLRI